MDGNTSLFVGSGPSVDSGLPSWNTLIAEMGALLLERANGQQARADLRQFLAEADHLSIAGYFRQAVHPTVFTKFLRERYRNRDFKLSPILKALAKLPATTIFTTNYDKLLEVAYRRRNGEDPAVVLEPRQLQALAPGEVKIIKVHGDIDNPTSIILGKEDYLGYEDKYGGIATYMQGQLAFSSLILVGFGLRDPNFERLYHAASRLIASNSPRVIALMVNQNQIDQDLWEAKNMEIINFPGPNQLSRYLRLVAKEIDR